MFLHWLRGQDIVNNIAPFHHGSSLPCNSPRNSGFNTYVPRRSIIHFGVPLVIVLILVIVLSLVVACKSQFHLFHNQSYTDFSRQQLTSLCMTRDVSIDSVPNAHIRMFLNSPRNPLYSFISVLSMLVLKTTVLFHAPCTVVDRTFMWAYLGNWPFHSQMCRQISLTSSGAAKPCSPPRCSLSVKHRLYRSFPHWRGSTVAGLILLDSV